MARNIKRHGLILRRGCYGFRYRDEAGQWREKSCGTSNVAEAKKVRDSFLHDLENAMLPTERSDWTVEQAASLWVQQHAAHLGPVKSKKDELSLFRQLSRRIGTRKLKAVTIDVIRSYQATRSTEVGARTVNLELRILVNVLREANLWPAIEKHYKPLKERESDTGHALTPEQLMTLEHTAASKPQWDVAYRCQTLAANTGMRGGEIKRLQLSDVNLELRRLRIRRQGTKTDAGARLVELNQAL